jgi:DICT domain-containing protein
MPVRHFVLVFDRPRGVIVEREDYEPGQRDAAWDARDRLERKYRGVPNVEVVLFGADSEETLRATHGRYFAEKPAA